MSSDEKGKIVAAKKDIRKREISVITISEVPINIYDQKLDYIK